MEVKVTGLEGVLLLTPDVFEDHRGEFACLWDEALYRRSGIAVRFIQDDISVSARGVLRGIHGDSDTVKLVTCLEGRIYAVAVDCREEAPTFGAWEAFTLTERNRRQLLVPAGFGLGHLALSAR